MKIAALNTYLLVGKAPAKNLSSLVSPAGDCSLIDRILGRERCHWLAAKCFQGQLHSELSRIWALCNGFLEIGKPDESIAKLLQSGDRLPQSTCIEGSGIA